MTETMTTAEKARRRQIATEQFRARKAWIAAGSPESDRPDTDVIDQIEREHAGVDHKPGTRKAKAKGEGRKPSPKDAELLEAFAAGKAAHPLTDPEIAKLMGWANSSTFHVVNRLVASEQLDVIRDGRVRRVWSKAAGPAPAVPAKPQAAPKSAGKLALAQTKSGTVHAGRRRRIEGVLTFVPTCIKGAGKIPATEPTTATEPTCKTCLKATAAPAAE